MNRTRALLATLQLVATAPIPAALAAQSPVSIEISLGSAMPTGELGESYTSSTTFALGGTLNFSPFLGIQAGYGRSRIACDHAQCAADVSAAMSGVFAGLVLTAPIAPVRPYATLGFTRPSFSQEGSGANGKIVAFETQQSASAPRLELGIEWVTAFPLAVRVSGFYASFKNHRPGPNREQEGPPFGQQAITGVYDGQGLVYGTDFDASYLGLQVGLRIFPPRPPAR